MASGRWADATPSFRETTRESTYRLGMLPHGDHSLPQWQSRASTALIRSDLTSTDGFDIYANATCVQISRCIDSRNIKLLVALDFQKTNVEEFVIEHRQLLC